MTKVGNILPDQEKDFKYQLLFFLSSFYVFFCFLGVSELRGRRCMMDTEDCLAPLCVKYFADVSGGEDKNIEIVSTSIIFLLVRDSWGSLYSVYLRRTLSMSVLAYWYSLLLLLKIIKAISQSQSTDSS